MEYTIKQIAEKCSLTAYTLRYYEKEGLLQFIRRDVRGNRVFSDNDVDWIAMICCLRNTGMSISKIKQYVDLCMEGSNTAVTREQIILQHKRTMEQTISQLDNCLAKVVVRSNC